MPFDLHMIDIRAIRLRVAIAGDHLRGERIGLEADPFARDAFDLRIDLGVSADRS